MKKNILIILSALLSIITIVGFVISYGALLMTAEDAGINHQYGPYFNTKWTWPLVVDFALLTFECGLFYVILFQPHLRRMLTGLVISFVMLTVFFNVIHGLPPVWPQSSTDWMRAVESAIAWSLPPIVQCLGVLVLSKIFHGLVQGREMLPREGIILPQIPVEPEAPAPTVKESPVVEPEAPAPVRQESSSPDRPSTLQQHIEQSNNPVSNNIVPVAFRAPDEPMVDEPVVDEDVDDELDEEFYYGEEDSENELGGPTLGEMVEYQMARNKKNLKQGTKLDVVEMYRNEGIQDPGTIAKRLNLSTTRVREILKEIEATPKF